MNKYFLLSINLKESRKVSMQKEVLFLSNKKDNEIFHHHILNDYCNNYKYIDFLPLLKVVEIYKTSKIKDIVQTLESGNNLLISDKLKNALTILPLNDVQFFKVSVFQGTVEYPDYWYMHATKNNDDLIDFEKSEIFWYESIVGHEGKVMSDINTFKDFSILEEKLKNQFIEKNILQRVKVKKIRFKENENNNLWITKTPHGTCMLYVSEEIKNEVEKQNCTGIRFLELDKNPFSYE